MTRLLLASSTVLSLILTGCGSSEFGDGTVRNIETAPIRLDAEQVVISQEQVNCGVTNELWDAPSAAGGNRTVARLSAKGRALKFDDDVVVTDPDFSTPHAQIRGDFNVIVMSVSDIKDGPEKDTKTAEVHMGVRIDHMCFAAPLPLMGLKKGNFSADAAPVLMFGKGDTWKFEKIIH